MGSPASHKILIITSGQPSLNPRLEKEADALCNAGYQVTIVYQYWNHWGTAMDDILLKEKKWKTIRVGGSPTDKSLLYWLTRIIHKAGKVLNNTLGNRLSLAELSIGRCTWLLTKEARKHKADIYIAHNLAALPAAVIAAKKHAAKSIFDAEDFHRNEVTDNPLDKDVILKAYIENKYIPQVNYMWTGSPGISAAYKKLFTGINPYVILNVFPAGHDVEAPGLNTGKTLKLFWFSQTIGPNRGLDDIIGALNLLNTPLIELHLLGYKPNSATEYLAQTGAASVNLHIHPPMPGKQINQFAARFDIGLALEPGFCRNNDIALSNKIFTYMQAGLAIIASDTSAQKALLDTYSQTGLVYKKGDVQMMASIINHYYNNRHILQDAKIASYRTARETLNWENESLILIKLVNNILAS